MDLPRPAVLKVTTPTSAGRAAPAHIAIIMDGNGRWARARNLPRLAGHREGVKAVRRIVKHAGESGLETLTLFSFSSENWSRPAEEVGHLLNLLRSYIHDDLESLNEAGVRVRVIGRRDNLNEDLQRLIHITEERTMDNRGMTLQVAFNYGARDEIRRAATRLAEQVKAGQLAPDAIDEQCFASALDTGECLDPDLIIRTSGEQRLSNFLLYQAAYAEFAFVNEYWPDFTEAVYDRVVSDYRQRDRRFGGL